MNNTIPLKIFIINLPEALDRRKKIDKLFKEKRLDYEFIEAVDGRQYDVINHPIYNATKRLLYFGKHMTGGEIGCFLSHKKVYQKMIDENIKKALIFEDDVILHDDFFDIVQKILSIPLNYDFVRFLGGPKLERLKLRNVYKLDSKYYLVRHKGTPGGLHATLMTSSGVKKIIKHLDYTAYPIDTLLGQNWLTGCNWFTVRPGLAIQDLSFQSSIGESRFDNKKDIQKIKKIIYPFTRAWFKFTETICKKYWYSKTYLKDKSNANF